MMVEVQEFGSGVRRWISSASARLKRGEHFEAKLSALREEITYKMCKIDGLVEDSSCAGYKKRLIRSLEELEQQLLVVVSAAIPGPPAAPFQEAPPQPPIQPSPALPVVPVEEAPPQPPTQPSPALPVVPVAPVVPVVPVASFEQPPLEDCMDRLLYDTMDSLPKFRECSSEVLPLEAPADVHERHCRSFLQRHCRLVVERSGVHYVAFGDEGRDTYELVMMDKWNGRPYYALRDCEMADEIASRRVVGYAVCFGGYTDKMISLMKRSCWSQEDPLLFRVVAREVRGKEGSGYAALPPALTIVDSPTDWCKIDALKDSCAAYRGPTDMYQNVIRALASKRSWAQSGIETQADLVRALLKKRLDYLSYINCGRKRARGLEE